jgi:probable phosphoglycerate mutase
MKIDSIPTKKECYKLLKENKTPSNIIKHSEVVLKVVLGIIKKLEKRGIKADKNLLMSAALLHDIVKHKPDHVSACEKYLRNRGYTKLANVVAAHSLRKLPGSLEGKIIFYADKRVKGDKIVSLEERFKYLKKRYSIPQKEIDRLYKFAKKVENELGF